MQKLPTPTEIAVEEAKQRTYNEVLRILDKAVTLEEAIKLIEQKLNK